LQEVPTLAKTLIDFAKDQEQFVIKGGILGDKLLTAEQVEELAKLPSLDELRAKIIGLIQTPAINIVSTINSGVQQVVNVLDAYARQGSEGEEE
jgi:large subunit ribosomal protein L10